jgi:hypothetical protein
MRANADEHADSHHRRRLGGCAIVYWLTKLGAAGGRSQSL